MRVSPWFFFLSYARMGMVVCESYLLHLYSFASTSANLTKALNSLRPRNLFIATGSETFIMSHKFSIEVGLMVCNRKVQLRKLLTQFMAYLSIIVKRITD